MFVCVSVFVYLLIFLCILLVYHFKLHMYSFLVSSVTCVYATFKYLTWNCLPLSQVNINENPCVVMHPSLVLEERSVCDSFRDNNMSRWPRNQYILCLSSQLVVYWWKIVCSFFHISFLTSPPPSHFWGTGYHPKLPPTWKIFKRIDRVGRSPRHLRKPP